MKRFYREVTIAPAEQAGGDGYRVLLDGRRVKSPGGWYLAVPTEPLAQAAAAEWDAQEEAIRPAAMPMAQLSFTAIDRVAPNEAAVRSQIVKYGETDLVCYRAAAPRDLADRQAAGWDPLLEWARDALGASLSVTDGVLPVAHPADALAALENHVAGFDAFQLTAVTQVVQSAGSLVIGLALAEGRLDAAAAVQASQLDETYQTEKWGQDKEAVDRLSALEADIVQAERFLGLLAE